MLHAALRQCDVFIACTTIVELHATAVNAQPRHPRFGKLLSYAAAEVSLCA
jgi:hypothetical protein